MHLLESKRPIKCSLYRCGKTYDLTYYEAINQATVEEYGLVIIGGSETIMYLIAGTSLKVVAKINILREKSHRAGGQSSARFQANRMNQMRDYSLLISAKVTEHFKKGTKICIVSNSGLGQKIQVSDDFIVVHMTADTNQLLSETVKLATKLLSELSLIDNNTMIDNIIDAFCREPDRHMIGSQELMDTIVLEPWTIDKIYIHKSMLDSLPDNLLDDYDVIVITAWTHEAAIFVNDYSGLIIRKK